MSVFYKSVRVAAALLPTLGSITAPKSLDVADPSEWLDSLPALTLGLLALPACLILSNHAKEDEQLRCLLTACLPAQSPSRALPAPSRLVPCPTTMAT